MTNSEQWGDFLGCLLSNAVTAHRDSKEYEYIRQRQEHIEEMRTTNLTSDQNTFIEEILYDLGLIAERETEVVYRRGFADCVWLLKKLEVLA